MAMSRTDLATAAESELADLEQLWRQMDLPGHRVELIDGQIVVSPSPSRRHSNVIIELIDVFAEVKKRDWQRHTGLTIHITSTRERLIPDFLVTTKDAPGFGDDEILSTGVLLVAEVVSPSSRRNDREVKHRIYAQSRIPLYLLIDKFADPPAVTIFSEPSDGGYLRRTSARAGRPLRLPEPFGIDLDTASLLS
jgi:Uma2 family endonuclease